MSRSYGVWRTKLLHHGSFHIRQRQSSSHEVQHFFQPICKRLFKTTFPFICCAFNISDGSYKWRISSSVSSDSTTSLPTKSRSTISSSAHSKTRWTHNLGWEYVQSSLTSRILIELRLDSSPCLMRLVTFAQCMLRGQSPTRESNHMPQNCAKMDATVAIYSLIIARTLM